MKLQRVPLGTMGDLDSVTAVILAGGCGTRLRPAVADRPKVLAEVRGRPFLAYLLAQVADCGVRDVVLCTGYLSDQVQAAFGETYGPLHLTYARDPEPLGTAGPLKVALPQMRSDPVLVMNGDSCCQADLTAFWAWHHARSAEATLLLTEVPDTRRYGRVGVDADGLVLRFDEKGCMGGPGWINAGVYLLSRRLIETIPSGRVVSLERDIFPTWIGRGLYGLQGSGRFLDIGTPESYALAEGFFAPGL